MASDIALTLASGARLWRDTRQGKSASTVLRAWQFSEGRRGRAAYYRWLASRHEGCTGNSHAFPPLAFGGPSSFRAGSGMRAPVSLRNRCRGLRRGLDLTSLSGRTSRSPIAGMDGQGISQRDSPGHCYSEDARGDACTSHGGSRAEDRPAFEGHTGSLESLCRRLPSERKHSSLIVDCGGLVSKDALQLLAPG